MSNFDMYQNSGYVNKRNRKRTLILDIDDSTTGTSHLGAGTEFNIKLFEPLIIDKHSEVYLDNCLTYNSNISQTISSSAFALRINEFNMNSNVASSSDNNTMFNSLIIPNDHKTVDNNHGAVVHKGKKFNYICDINPQTIHSLSGKITDLSGSPIFHGTGTEEHTYALTGIDTGITPGTVTLPITNDLSYTAIAGGGLLVSGGGAAGGQFIVTHFGTAKTIHFSSDKVITLPNRSEMSDIVFTVAGGTYTISNTGSENPNLHLLKNPGRFIAEFSIISV
jgi:hypothetical protein